MKREDREFNIWEEKEEILFLLDGNWGKGDERGGRWEMWVLLGPAFFVHVASQNPPKSGKFHFDYNGDYETERVLIMSGEATLTPDDGSEEIVIGKGDQVGCLGAQRGGSPSPYWPLLPINGPFTSGFLPPWFCLHMASDQAHDQALRLLWRGGFTFSWFFSQTKCLKNYFRMGRRLLPIQALFHTSYLSFFLHRQNFWRIEFTPKNA